MLFHALYSPSTWPDTATTLYQLADYLYSNNTWAGQKRELPHLEPPASLWGIPRRSERRSSFFNRNLNKRSDDGSLYDYALQAITCADAVDAGNTTTADVFGEILEASLNSSMMFGPLFGRGGFWCHVWPARGVERYSGPWNHTLKNPIIVIGNKADPITPLPGAQYVAESLGSSAYLVEQDDYGHTSLAEHSDCTLSIVAAFFNNGTYPTNDQFCSTNQPLFPTNSITKQSLEEGITDPALDPEVAVPGWSGPKGGSPTVNAADETPADSTTTVTTTATVTVSPASSGGVDKKTQDEIDDLKSQRKSLEIALAALGGAFLLAIGFVVFSAIRGRQGRSYTPAGIPIVSNRSGGGKKRGSRGIPVDLDDHDGEDAFLPPMKEGQSLHPTGYANESPRASMETLKGYSDPYDPPASALGSTSLSAPRSGAPGLGAGGPSSRPSSPGYNYASGGAEYRD